jgi:hypothetical protein
VVCHVCQFDPEALRTMNQAECDSEVILGAGSEVRTIIIIVGAPGTGAHNLSGPRPAQGSSQYEHVVRVGRQSVYIRECMGYMEV